MGIFCNLFSFVVDYVLQPSSALLCSAPLNYHSGLLLLLLLPSTVHRPLFLFSSTRWLLLSLESLFSFSMPLYSYYGHRNHQQTKIHNNTIVLWSEIWWWWWSDWSQCIHFSFFWARLFIYLCVKIFFVAYCSRLSISFSTASSDIVSVATTAAVAAFRLFRRDFMSFPLYSS